MGHVIVLQDITKDKELDRMKSDFVSNVSHELRTPLTSIKSFSELILDDLDTMDGEIQKRFPGIIRDEAERLTRLISDLLDLQKIQANRMKWGMETIDLPQLIENSVGTFSGLAKMKRIHLSFECKGELPAIHGDRDRLQQVLVNLISNAIRFSRENGQIRIEAAEVSEGVLIFSFRQRDRDPRGQIGENLRTILSGGQFRHQREGGDGTWAGYFEGNYRAPWRPDMGGEQSGEREQVQFRHPQGAGRERPGWFD